MVVDLHWAPAPWQLRATGYILALKLDAARLRAEGFMIADRAAVRVGPLAYVLFVDYTESPVGPYQELLFIPGAFRSEGRIVFTVTKIFVSSEASVQSGRRNWGLPKELAEFRSDSGEDRTDRVRMFQHGRTVVDLSLGHYPIPLPLVGSLFPAKWRTLEQFSDGRRFRVAPTATGSMRIARLHDAEMDPRFFPTFGPHDVLAAVKVTEASIRFPAARIDRISRGHRE